MCVYITIRFLRRFGGDEVTPQKSVEVEPNFIDFENNPYRVVSVWIDSNIALLSGYASMRVAVAVSDWDEMARYLNEQHVRSSSAEGIILHYIIYLIIS